MNVLLQKCSDGMGMMLMVSVFQSSSMRSGSWSGGDEIVTTMDGLADPDTLQAPTEVGILMDPASVMVLTTVDGDNFTKCTDSRCAVHYFFVQVFLC